MAVNVTYLLGAGASFDIIPLVKRDLSTGSFGISKDILNLADALKRRTTDLTPDQNAFLTQMKNEFEEIGGKAVFFTSPDTYARSLFLKGGQEHKINLLKRVLSFYLTWKQLKNPKLTDKRYVPFLAGILSEKENITIPENIKILNWNYDFQLELALRHYKPELESLHQIQNQFKIVPTTGKVTQPSIIHLNGIAGMFKDSQGMYFNPYEKKDQQSENDFLLSTAIDDYKVWSGEGREIGELLSFAWEIAANQRIADAKEIMLRTEVLVVIGYSFPFFNRNIDRLLFEALLSESTEVNVDPIIYIQDPEINEDRIDFLRQRFDIDNEIEIKPIRDVDQFFLPPEL
jgi:hypothetical protein